MLTFEKVLEIFEDYLAQDRATFIGFSGGSPTRLL